MFDCLSDGNVCTKLDTSQAYAQMYLEEEFKKYTVINSHRDLFQYNWLCSDISSATGIFKQGMEDPLKYIPG